MPGFANDSCGQNKPHRLPAERGYPRVNVQGIMASNTGRKQTNGSDRTQIVQTHRLITIRWQLGGTKALPLLGASSASNWAKTTGKPLRQRQTCSGDTQSSHETTALLRRAGIRRDAYDAASVIARTRRRGCAAGRVISPAEETGMGTYFTPSQWCPDAWLEVNHRANRHSVARGIRRKRRETR